MSAKITYLQTENFKRLLAATVDEKTLARNLVVVSGKNGAGKSSFIDSIEVAIRGKVAMPSKPVRRGEDRARIFMKVGDVAKIGELTIKRTITAAGGNALEVTNGEGVKLTSPQAVLDALYGEFTFDPLHFLEMKPAERTDTLRKLMGLDFSKLDAEREGIFSERTAVNRVLHSLESVVTINRIKRVADVPVEEINVNDLLAQLEKAQQANASHKEKRDALERWKERAATQEAEIKNADERIAGLHEQIKAVEQARDDRAAALAGIRKSLKELESAVADLNDVPTEPLSKRIREAQTTNLHVRTNKEIDAQVSKLKATRLEADKLTAKIEAIDRQKRQAVLEAKFPIEGLILDDAGEVLFNGIPFDQLNTAQQIRVSVAMGIALNPDFPVMLIRRGSDLDPDNLKLLAELAEQHKAQVFLESSRTDAPATVVIEDGQIAGVSTNTPGDQGIIP